MKNEIQERLLELVQACQKFKNDNLPSTCHFSIELSRTDATIQIHTMANHVVGLEVMRLLGIKEMEKSNYNERDRIWHAMQGDMTDGVRCNIYCDGLPPTCRIETYDEVIPKEQVIQTGEKTVVRRTRICCGTDGK